MMKSSEGEDQMVQSKLMRYSGLPQVINKNTTELRTAEGGFRQPLSLMNPIIEMGGDVQNLFASGTCTYMQVDGKFYYVMDYEFPKQNLTVVHLHLDVLMTYKSEVNSLNIMLERSSAGGDPDMEDTMMPISNNVDIEKYNLPHAFNQNEADGVYVLVTSQSDYDRVGMG